MLLSYLLSFFHWSLLFLYNLTFSELFSYLHQKWYKYSYSLIWTNVHHHKKFSATIVLSFHCIAILDTVQYPTWYCVPSIFFLCQCLFNPVFLSILPLPLEIYLFSLEWALYHRPIAVAFLHLEQRYGNSIKHKTTNCLPCKWIFCVRVEVFIK